MTRTNTIYLKEMPSTKKGPADEAPKLERQRAETRDEKNLIHYIKHKTMVPQFNFSPSVRC